MRWRPAPLPLLLLATLSSACPASVDGTVADGGAVTPTDSGGQPPVDATPAGDVPRGPCRWRAGEAVVLPAVTSMASHRSILDVRPAEGGAWVLTADDAGGDRQADVALERVDATGHRRADGVVRFPLGYSPSEASLAIDETLGRRAVLEEVRDLRGGSCGWTALDARGNPSPRRMITFPMGGFSLAGCRDLLPNATGYTFLAEQVRALWGASVVQLDAMGGTPEQLAPAVLDGFPEVPFARFALPDRSFVVVSGRTSGRPPRTDGLHVRRYDDRGQPRGESHVAVDTPDTLRDFMVTVAGDGLLALWEHSPDTPPATWGVSVRPLDVDGRPRGEARVVWAPGSYRGGLAAVFAGGDVLAAGVVGTDVSPAVVTRLAPDGSQRGEVIPIPMPAGVTRVERMRLVATPPGALVVYTTDPGRYPNVLVAVPLTCEP